ncbi:MAG: GerW family sporulation protein [Clostridia bacterium]|nr:GerW family sporulation protein [Clostridia bacterium]MBO5912112.1 GerW family sporulation protein [Clostridia bacterium]
MAENSISGILDSTMEKLRTLVDAETVIGQPVIVGDITIIPVSKVSFGLASGGSDFPSKSINAKMFGGGSGAGATVTPMCFLVVKGNEVKLLSATPSSSPIEKTIDAIPGIVDKVSALFKKDKDADELIVSEEG